VLPDHGLHGIYVSGLLPGDALGLALQKADCLSASSLVATNGDVYVNVAGDQVLDFLARHADRLLIPSDPEWFLEIHGCPADAWEQASPGSVIPKLPVPFVNLTLLRWALRMKNERPLGSSVEKLARTLAYSRGAGKDEMAALQGLLEAGLTECEAGIRGTLAGKAAAALLLYRLFLRRIQRRGRRRDKVLARLARYRPQLPVVIQEQIFGAARSEPVTAGEPTASAPASLDSENKRTKSSTL